MPVEECVGKLPCGRLQDERTLKIRKYFLLSEICYGNALSLEENSSTSNS